MNLWFIKQTCGGWPFPSRSCYPCNLFQVDQTQLGFESGNIFQTGSDILDLGPYAYIKRNMTRGETITASRDGAPYLACGAGGGGGMRLHCQLASQHLGVEVVQYVIQVIGQVPEVRNPEFDKGTRNLLLLGVVEHIMNTQLKS